MAGHMMEEISGLLLMLVDQPGEKTIEEDAVEEVAVEAGEGEGATQDQEAVVDAPEAGVADVVTVPEISPEIVPGTVVTGQDPDLGTEEDPAIEGDLPQSRGAAATEAA